MEKSSSEIFPKPSACAGGFLSPHFPSPNRYASATTSDCTRHSVADWDRNASTCASFTTKQRSLNVASGLIWLSVITICRAPTLAAVSLTITVSSAYGEKLIDTTMSRALMRLICSRSMPPIPSSRIGRHSRWLRA